jgi:hypothetical protein
MFCLIVIRETKDLFLRNEFIYLDEFFDNSFVLHERQKIIILEFSN